MRIRALAIFAIGTISAGPAAARRTIQRSLPARVPKLGRQLLRMRLYVAASVQRVGFGPRRPVRHQSLFRGRGRARELSAASPRLLKNEPYRPLLRQD